MRTAQEIQSALTVLELTLATCPSLKWLVGPQVSALRWVLDQAKDKSFEATVDGLRIGLEIYGGHGSNAEKSEEYAAASLLMASDQEARFKL